MRSVISLKHQKMRREKPDNNSKKWINKIFSEGWWNICWNICRTRFVPKKYDRTRVFLIQLRFKLSKMKFCYNINQQSSFDMFNGCFTLKTNTLRKQFDIEPNFRARFVVNSVIRHCRLNNQNAFCKQEVKKTIRKMSDIFISQHERIRLNKHNRLTSGELLSNARRAVGLVSS